MPDVFPILLSGSPGSGKSTLTDHLLHAHPEYCLLRKLKDSRTGSPDGYDIISPLAFDRMIDGGLLLQWNERYGRRYGVAAKDVHDILARGQYPVVHLGRHETLQAMRAALPKSASILLWADMGTLQARLQQRHADDPAELDRRLQAIRQEIEDLQQAPRPLDFDIVVRNDGTDAAAAMECLHNSLTRWIGDGAVCRRDAPLAQSLLQDAVLPSGRGMAARSPACL